MSMRRVMAVGLLAVLFQRPAWAAYQLVQAVYKDDVYFYDAHQSGVIFTGKYLNEYGAWNNDAPYSNILIRVTPVGVSSEDGSGAYKAVIGGNLDLASYYLDDLNTWWDEKGHIHTLAILKTQIAYNKWLLARVNECGSDCTLTIAKGRPHQWGPCHIRPVELTGIMDRDTLAIPLMKLEWRYFYNWKAFADECKNQYPCWPDIDDPQSTNTSQKPVMQYWAEALRQARAATNKLSGLLDHVSFKTPRPPSQAALDIWNKSSLGNPYGGLKISHPNGGYYSSSSIPSPLTDLGSGVFKFVPSDSSPETKIEKSADPRLDAVLLTSIETARQEAEKAMLAAEQLGPTPAEGEVLPIQ